MIDLDAYFARIGFGGSARPTLATLAELVALHPAAIAFENLDPLLGRSVSLDPAALERKLVRGRRGGYCYEHNSLFWSVLETVGFAVTAHLSRVLWHRAPGAPPPARDHMFLCVDLDARTYLVDVGFAGHFASVPLVLESGIVQPTPNGDMRLTVDGHEFTLALRTGEGWRVVYTFSREPQIAADFSIANWFAQTHPRSYHRYNLVLERKTTQRHTSVANRRVVRSWVDGRRDETRLNDPAELVAILTDDLEIEPPPGVEAILAILP